jgi:hypothetical protein
LIGSNDDRELGSQIIMASSGGIAAIVSAMKTFPRSGDVQNAALDALLQIIACQEDQVKASVRRFVKDLDGISLVLRAIEQFPVSALCSKTAAEFCFICLPMTRCTMMHWSKEGAVKAVKAAATVQRDLFDYVAVKAEATDFLSNMFHRDEDLYEE